MILVSVGTEQYPFNALLNWVQALIDAGFIAADEEVIVQYGASTQLPDRVKIYQRLPEAEFKALVAQARLVIAHCGEGTALLLKNFETPYVLVPRTHSHGEHVDDHQLEMAAALEKQGVAIARSPADLVRFLAAPTLANPLLPLDDRLCEALNPLFPNPRSQEVMLVCSAGGHFKAMEGLRGFWERFAARTWVTFQTPVTEADLAGQGDRVYWAYHPTNRNIPNLVRNLLLATGVLRRECPDVVVSTGAGVAVPFLLLAKWLRGSTIVFVESKTRLQKLSLSARLLRQCGALDHLVIQSQALTQLYPEAIVVDMETLWEQDSGSSNSLAQSALQPTWQGPSGKMLEADSDYGWAPVSAEEDTPIWPVQGAILVAAPEQDGTLDADTLEDRMQWAYDALPRAIALDMQEVQAITSEGLNALLRVWRRADLAETRVVLWSVQPTLLSVLTRARFDRLFEIVPGTAAIRPVNALPVARPTPPVVMPQSPWRRAVDVGVALAGLGITSVLLVPIAIAIKLDSAGPIFTSEMRSGYMGQQFSAWKFRTQRLRPTREEMDSPPHLTRIGRLLQTLRLDKLPLFWNVLVGDMRLLGAYAPRFQSVELVDLVHPNRVFMDSKPGILGEWRSGWDGANSQFPSSQSPMVKSPTVKVKPPTVQPSTVRPASVQPVVKPPAPEPSTAKNRAVRLSVPASARTEATTGGHVIEERVTVDPEHPTAPATEPADR
jgi:lipopolysaccharide/colanic/teichoic acid biosynthesis glycosyltransferase/UDP-N-acetylglucosamine transferase subunit ALG13/anti-anti-sigma regulatory factor